MTSTVSFTGYDSTDTEKTLVFTKLDPQVERTWTNDPILLPIPTDDETSGQFGYDILMGKDEFVLTCVLKSNGDNIKTGTTPYTGTELYLLLFDIIKHDDENKSFVFCGQTYNVIVTRLHITQTPGKIDMFDLNMAMALVRSD
jgi:hypothetical protein